MKTPKSKKTTSKPKSKKTASPKAKKTVLLGKKKPAVSPKKKVVKKTKTKTKSKIKVSHKKKDYGFVRAKGNPIILPRDNHGWEKWQTFNPGVVMLPDGVHFIYRAIGDDGVSRLGYAVSKDGISIDNRLHYPVYEHRIFGEKLNYYSFASGGSFGGSEDPRLVKMEGEDNIYMTYTACDGGLNVGLTSIKVKDFLNKNWNWVPPAIISPPGETHKNWVLFPEKIKGKYAILHSICPEVSIAYEDSLEFPKGKHIKSHYNGNLRRKNCWDNWVRGVGAPPLKTKDGWLVFYHAMDNTDPGKYKVGALLLDLKDPENIICRAQGPILEPEKDYENNGFKAGVVYVSGAVIKDGELLVYYGASDSYISVAHANLDEFLKELKKQKPMKLTAKNLSKK